MYGGLAKPAFSEVFIPADNRLPLAAMGCYSFIPYYQPGLLLHLVAIRLDDRFIHNTSVSLGICCLSLIPDTDICLFRFRDRQNSASEDAPLLIPGTCECVKFTWQRRIKGADEINVDNQLDLQ